MPYLQYQRTQRRISSPAKCRHLNSPPTVSSVELPPGAEDPHLGDFCNGARFRDGKVAHEHIYWDQASVLKQIGLLTDPDLPGFGGETARKVAAPLGCIRSSQ